jgi:uncharacterized membrane protein
MVKIHQYVTLKSFLFPLVVSSVFSTVIPFALLGIPSNAVARTNKHLATTVASPAPTPAPVVSSVSVNGSSGPMTVPAGGILTVGVQNGGTATAWVALYKTTDPNYVPNNYLFMNGAQTPPTTLITSATFTFTVPTTGTYEFRLFANNIDFTKLATSPTVTVASPAPTPAPVVSSASYTLTITQNGTGQGNTTGAGTYASGTVVTMTATAASGSTFGGWSGTGCSTGTVTMSANTTCTATFTLVSPPTTSTCPADAFYVSVSGNDSNPGTPSQPWRTMKKTTSALTAGQTACVMDGTYTEGEIAFRSSGLQSAPIRLMAQNQWKAILSSISGCAPSISLYGSWITIDGLLMQVSSSDPGCSTGTTGNYAIHAWGDVNTVAVPLSLTAGATIRGVKIVASSKRNGAMKTNQDFSLIENNIFNDGIESFNNQGTIFRNNTIFGTARDWIDLVVAKGGTRGIQVYGNIVHIANSNNMGIELGGSSGSQWLFDPSSGVECYDCQAYGNTVINDTTSSVGLWGYAGAKNSSIHNNIGNHGGKFLRSGGSPGSYGSTNPDSTFYTNTIDGVLVP